MSVDEVGRHTAGIQGRGLFCSVNGGQEENLGSDDEDSSVGDKKRGAGEGGGCGALEILDLIAMHPV